MPVVAPDMCALWLGCVEYVAAWQLQRELADLRAANRIGDTLLLLEHPSTITLGRGADLGNVLVAPDRLDALDVAVVHTDRGGDVTWHGPGQLVGYPIFDLNARGRDLHRFLRDIEQALIVLLGDYELSACRLPPHTGVWVGDRKIAAIGIKVSRWISIHGFALNVAAETAGFNLIVPCGIRDYGVTSVEAETHKAVALMDIAPDAVRAFRQVFGGGHRRPPDASGLTHSSQEILSQAVSIE